MPKLTRDGFTQLVDRMWDQAVDNFERSEFLAPALVGVDQMSRPTRILGLSPEQAADPAQVAEAERAGVAALPMPFTDHLPQIRDLFTRQRVVAAAVLGEAWAAAGDVSEDVVNLGLRVADHPLRDEVIFLAAAWPREHLRAVAVAEVVRDDVGQNPTLRRWRPEPASDHDLGLSSWLLQVLPGPHR